MKPPKFQIFCQHFGETTKIQKIIHEYKFTKIKKYEWFPMKSNIGDILDKKKWFIFCAGLKSNWCLCTCCVMMHIITRKPCGIGGFWTKLQIKKRAIFLRVFQNAKNGPFFDFKTQKMVLFFIKNLPLCDFFSNFWKFFSDHQFFSKN